MHFCTTMSNISNYYCYLLQIFSLNLVGKYCYIHSIFFFFYISECNFNTVAGSNHCEVIQVRILVNNHQAVSRHGTHKTVSKAQSYFPTTPRQEADLGLLCTGQIKCWHLTMEVKALPLNSSWYCPHIPVYATQNLAFCLNTKKEKHFVFKLNKILIGSPSLFIKSLHLALHWAS